MQGRLRSPRDVLRTPCQGPPWSRSEEFIANKGHSPLQSSNRIRAIPSRNVGEFIALDPLTDIGPSLAKLRCLLQSKMAAERDRFKPRSRCRRTPWSAAEAMREGRPDKNPPFA